MTREPVAAKTTGGSTPSSTRPRGLPRGLTQPASTATAAACGAVLALLTGAVYFIGAGRALDYDSSLTVGTVVKTHSLLDPLRRQLQLNNHPLFSVVEHIVWSLGVHTEAGLRVAPIVFGALTVAIIAAWCARCWGLLAGVSAGTLVAANPLFADLSRAVRGYSLLVLCAVASTLVLWRLLAAAPDRATRGLEYAYVVLVAAGISTHLYGCVVLVGHLLIVLLRGRLNADWVRRWVAGVFFGSLVYVKMIQTILNTHNERTFHNAFPRELTTALLGQARVAVAVLAVLMVVAAWLARSRRDLIGGFAAVLAFIAIVWLVVQPQFLVVRYMAWLIPGVALAAAFVVARRPIVTVLVVVAVVAMVSHQWAHWTAIQVPSSETAALLDAARSDGMRVCGLAHTGAAVLAYTRQPDRPKKLADFAQCDLVMGFYVTPYIESVERAQFRYHWMIPGGVPAFIFSNQPRAKVVAAMKAPHLTLETHPITYPK